jgi:hypothetical protein
MKAGDAAGTGTVDPKTQAEQSRSHRGEFKTEVLLVDPEVYARITGLPVPGVDATKWLKIDRTKIKSFGALGIHDVNDRRASTRWPRRSPPSRRPATARTRARST